MTPQIDHLTFEFEKGFKKEIAHFVECCQQGKESICPVEDGVEMMKMLCGIYESSETGREIVYE